MTAPVGQLSQVAANTEFLGQASAIFDARPQGMWTQLAETIPLAGQSMELDALGPSPAVRQMTGSRRFANLRAYALRVPAVTYSADAIELPRIMVDNDKSGIVNRRLANYLGMTADFLEKPVIEKLLSNPTGIDQTALFSNSHPYGPGGATWNNITASGLTQTTLEAGFVAMRSYRFENGEPGGFRPTTLVVGPALEREALDLIGDARMLPVDNTGAPDASGSVVAAVMIKNWVGGRLNLMVVDRFADGTHDTDWFLADLSKPGIRPLVVGEARAPQGNVVDQPNSEPVLQRDSYAYFVDAVAAISGYAPQTVYGKMS